MDADKCVTQRDKSEIIDVYSPETDEYSILAAHRIGENTARLIDPAHVKNNSTTSFTEDRLFDSGHSELAIAPRPKAECSVDALKPCPLDDNSFCSESDNLTIKTYERFSWKRKIR
jgi:hypothetical protein